MGPLLALQFPEWTIPGKLESGVRNASFDVSRPGSANNALGRVGQMLKALVIGTDWIMQVVGVHGKPVCALRMPFTCQPPTIFPTQSARVRKKGKSHKLVRLKLCLESKSEGPCSVWGCAGSVWLVCAPGPSFDN